MGLCKFLIDTFTVPDQDELNNNNNGPPNNEAGGSVRNQVPAQVVDGRAEGRRQKAQCRTAEERQTDRQVVAFKPKQATSTHFISPAMLAAPSRALTPNKLD